MKLKYIAHSCFKFTYDDGTVLITDPYDETVPYPPCTEACDAALISHDHFDHNHVQSLSGHFETIMTAGSFKVGDLRITATQSFHDPEQGALRGKNLMFRIDGEGLSIAHIGDLGHIPNKHQMEALADLDVLLLPIGGHFTIDTRQAEEIIRELKPRVAIAMHFKTDAIADWPISTEEQFERDMHAVRMSREIEITHDNVGSLPKTIIMAYK